MAAKDEPNGLKPVKISSQATPPRRAPTGKRARPLGRLVSTTLRLATWYAILIILFRCPASLDACSASTPRICTTYLEIEQAVVPYVQPYYHTYAAPYVDAVQPYYAAVDRAVLAPARHYATQYGAPRVQQLRTLVRAQWDKNVQPQLVTAQAAATAQYEQRLAPYVDQAVAAVGPYLALARANAQHTYEDVVLPAYRVVAPYAVRAYVAASVFVTDTAVPTAVWTWRKVAAFLDGAVWPRLQVLYVDTVEPQLVKIGQRLGRYSGETKQKTIALSTTTSSFTKPTQPATTNTPATSNTPASSQAPAVTAAAKLQGHAPVAPPDEPEQDEDEQRRVARETVAEDLRAWQEKYAKAADEGAAEMEKRVEEIATRMIRRQARTQGRGLVTELEQAVEAALVQLRHDIAGAVAAVADGTATEDAAEATILAAVRKAGVQIKERAQAVRSWRAAYSEELEQTVNRAAENHFTILGSIRDLALQKIGMKWAWMEGVTYRDWAKYHQLKGRFDEWEGDLEQLIVTNPALSAAQATGQAIEDEAMHTAAAAAKELGRLKQVGAWKVVARDASEDFDSETAEAAAAAAVAAAEAGEAGETEVEGETTEAEGETEVEETEVEAEAESEVVEAEAEPEEAAETDVETEDTEAEEIPAAPETTEEPVLDEAPETTADADEVEETEVETATVETTETTVDEEAPETALPSSEEPATSAETESAAPAATPAHVVDEL